MELSPHGHQCILQSDCLFEPVKLIDALEKYRTGRPGNRHTRTNQIDHDVFEGLPVRHWRKKPISFNAAPEKDVSKATSMLQPRYRQLPLPRDINLLPENSQALLRATRMSAPKVKLAADEDKDNDEDDLGKTGGDAGFVAHKWALVPRDDEGPEPEYLAKRRKGLPSVYSGLTAPVGAGTQMRRTKIRKADAEGNSYVWEVMVPEGQHVDGEIVEEGVIPMRPPVPGTIVEGLGVVNYEGIVIAGEQAAPPAATRRKPPIPKKRKHGPGRGRKKKIEPMMGQEGGLLILRSTSRDGANATDQHVSNGILKLGNDPTMHDGHQDEEEGSEEGSEGEEGEEGYREDGEISPSPSAAPSPSKPVPSTANTPPHAAKQDSIPIKPHKETVVDEQNPHSATTSKLHYTEVDTQESAMTTPLKAMDADTAVPANVIVNKPTTLHPVVAASDENQDRRPAIDLANDTVLCPELKVPSNDQPAAFPPEEEEVFISDSPDLLLAPSPQETAAQQPTVETNNTPGPPTQDTYPPVDPLEAYNSPRPATPPPTDALASAISQAASRPLGLSDTPSQSSQDPSSPPTQTSQTMSQCPEPITALPQKPPTMSAPEGGQHVPPSHSLENHRRPSTSTPKAPTPSPPTPIDTTFDKLHPGRSPIAPTVSPPTPFELDSSPETALADEPRRPPPLSLPGSGFQSTLPPIPGLQYLEARVDVEAAPPVDGPHYNVEIPHEHNPPDKRKTSGRDRTQEFAHLPPLHARMDAEAALSVDVSSFDAEIPHNPNSPDGLQALEPSPNAREPNSQGAEQQQHQEEGNREVVVRFSDGAEDLLGTLERSLSDVGRGMRN
ncbi:MAG: hypothetical protein Q9163_002198 [Psora crenata]